MLMVLAGNVPWATLPVRSDGNDLIINTYDIGSDVMNTTSNTYYYITVASCTAGVTYNRSNVVGEFSFALVPEG